MRIEVKRALVDRGACFSAIFCIIEWNEMAIRTIVIRWNVDYYGCRKWLSGDTSIYTKMFPRSAEEM